jgi:hypothetical protein
MRIIGIDPGKTGALTAIDMQGKYICHMLGTDCREAIAFLGMQPSQSVVYIEKAQCMPKNGAVGMFRYGQGYGELIGAIKALNLAYREVPPSLWSKALLGSLIHLKGKDRNVELCKRLFPGLSLLPTKRTLQPHLGLVDASLIAEYGRRLLLQLPLSVESP